jgi:hypothetical protein
VHQPSDVQGRTMRNMGVSPVQLPRTFVERADETVVSDLCDRLAVCTAPGSVEALR